MFKKIKLNLWKNLQKRSFGTLFLNKEAICTDNNDLVSKAYWRPTHTHEKGGEYRLLAYGFLESDRCDVAIYEDNRGIVWVRCKGEFLDGRFRPIVDE